MDSIHTFVVLAYKESKYLEKCIESVLNQEYKSEVIIATSTPNEYITNIANKYNLKLIENPNKGKGIGADFDFALSCGNTELVTVAHQDDIYDKNYSSEIVKAYNKKALIIFSDYYEIKNDKKVVSNLNLKIKRFMLLPIRFRFFGNYKFFKRLVLRFGCSICCPSVTFVKRKIDLPLFNCDLKCDIDWYAWESLSKQKGAFVLINKKVMGHRVHDGSETSAVLGQNGRITEDYIMFNKFWPKFISKMLVKLYVNSEKSNKVK